MEFIIKIADQIRHGVYPRIPEFVYSHEFGTYIYLGRRLTLDEFNAAATRIFNPDFRGLGFTFCPVVFPGIETTNRLSTIDVSPDRFRMEGTEIYEGENRVGGLFEPGNHLRVTKGRSDLRPVLEQWLNQNNTLAL